MKIIFFLLTTFSLCCVAGDKITWQQVLATLNSNKYVDFSVLVRADELPIDNAELQLLSHCLADTNIICVTNNISSVNVQKCELAFLMFETVTGAPLDLCHDMKVRDIMSAPADNGEVFREHFIVLSESDMRFARALVEMWLHGYNKATEKPASD